MNQTYISVFVVALILLYWFKKRKRIAAEKCSDIWTNVDNPLAKNYFFNALSLSENDPDLRETIKIEAEKINKDVDYTRCMWAAHYVFKQRAVSQGEYQKMESCLCQKFI